MYKVHMFLAIESLVAQNCCQGGAVPQGGVVTGTLILICFGFLVLVVAAVLAFGLAGSRKPA